MISRMSKITIVGLGLLGGSYAKGFFNAGYHNIYGIDIDPKAIEFGKKMRWIQDGGDDTSLVEGSDIVISALYPHAFVQWVKENQHHLKPGSILTDVTGIKREVIVQVKEILRDDVEYVPVHPMAGREYKGIQFCDPSLFTKANYIIVDDGTMSERGKQVAYDIGRILSFRHIAELTPQQHDEMIGFLSQLTHVIAVCLMNTNDNSKLSEYTGDSFRDLTRIAKINEDLWPELFEMNKDYLINEIDGFVNEMMVFKDLLVNDDLNGMKEKMIQSTQRRRAFDK